MEKFVVQISVVHYQNFVVEAESAEKAEEIAREKWENEELNVDCSDNNYGYEIIEVTGKAPDNATE